MRLFDFGGIIPEANGYAIVDLDKVEGIYVDNMNVTTASYGGDTQVYSSTTYRRVIIQTEQNKIVAGIFSDPDGRQEAVALAQKLAKVLHQQLKNSNATK